MNIKYLLIFLILCFHSILEAILQPYKIEKIRDYELLEKFFRISFKQEEYGYVLDGIKPISIRNFYHPIHIPITADICSSQNEILKSLLIFEAIPILKKIRQHEKNFVLKVTPLNVLGDSNLGVEVQFINVPILCKVIEENISLFKYILGPHLNSKDLVDRIAFSDESLSDILLENHTLIGIVLGFGSHNSLIGGRQEEINFLSFSQDMAPFASKGLVFNSSKECYGWHYLNAVGGNDRLMSFRIDYLPLIPKPGFLTIKEEIETISQLNEPLPKCLLDEEPCFYFGAYKGDTSNKKLFDALKKSQKNVQQLLKKEDFLENILTKILDKKPCICCEKPNSSPLDFSFFKGSIDSNGWREMLLQISDTFEDEQKLIFFKTFFNPPDQPTMPCRMNSSKFTLTGLKKALENFSITKKYFEDLINDPTLSMVVKDQLYFKILQQDYGKTLNGSDRIKINYHITDLNHNILSANYNTWLSISQLIPGFAHGLKDMKIGEKRQIYIHPSLAYGILTTLPPAMGLIAYVQLIDIDEKYSKSMPPLMSFDCTWIEDPILLKEIEESITGKPHFLGWFYHQLINKIEGSESQNIISSLNDRIW